MRFRRLSFQNFGLLAGQQSIDLRVDGASGNRNIILIGGRNGAGKTTILEALRLCLYGKAAFGHAISAADYQDYLLSRIHRPPGSGPAPDSANVLLEFELTTNGATDVYKVQRSWRRRSEGGSTVTEQVLILKNDDPLDEVEADYWQDFIQGLIPSGLSQLFFFDGEQIQALANEETDTRALGDAVKALLGLEIVERLRADLAIYMAREVRKASQQQASQLDRVGADFEVALRELDALRAARDGVGRRAAELRREIGRVEQALMAAGRGFYDDREKLQQKRAELEAAAGLIEKRLAELAEAELPFSLCPALCHGLRDQLRQEAALGGWVASREHVRSFADDLQDRAKKAGKAGAGVEQLIAAALADAARPPEALADVRPIHGLSANARIQVETWLDAATNKVPAEVRALLRDLERVQRKLQQAQRALAQVPEQDALKPLMERLFNLQRELADLTVQDADLDAAIADKQRLAAQAERAVERAEGQLRDVEAQERRLAYAARTQEALRTFQERLTAAKLRRLEEEFVGTFNHLSRKLVVGRATIRPDDFRVELFDAAGAPLPKTQFSAGEKQIYAIAMLWSLAKISGRQLPVVIDTPLGRLDAVHRDRLLERYFPEAAHQVVVLSTDTEIDQTYAARLQSHVARAYHLRHERGDQLTLVEDGYFWKEPINA